MTTSDSCLKSSKKRRHTESSIPQQILTSHNQTGVLPLIAQPHHSVDTGDTSCILFVYATDVTLSAAITRILDYDFPHLRQCSVSNTMEHSRRVGGSYRSTGTSSSDSSRGDAKSVSVWRLQSLCGATGRRSPPPMSLFAV